MSCVSAPSMVRMAALAFGARQMKGARQVADGLPALRARELGPDGPRRGSAPFIAAHNRSFGVEPERYRSGVHPSM